MRKERRKKLYLEKGGRNEEQKEMRRGKGYLEKGGSS